jgi:transcriptional regulator with XRE-family HTH domain
MPSQKTIQSQQIDLFQDSLKKIRTVIGWSGASLAEILGVSRQTINNLESKKTAMSVVQYLAFGAAVEQAKKRSPETMRIIDALLSGFPQIESGIARVGSFNLVDEWFLGFPDYFNFITPNENALSSFELIEKIATDYKIFVCPEVFQVPGVLAFLDAIELPLKKNENKLILPATAIKDLSLSLDVVEKINILTKENLAEFKGDVDDPQINELVLSLCARFRSKYKICIITQDSLLAMDVLTLNSLRSQYGAQIVVIKLNTSGDLLNVEVMSDSFAERKIIDGENLFPDFKSSDLEQASTEDHEKKNPIAGWRSL